MSNNQLPAIDVGKQNSTIIYKQSANTLFNFMSKYEFLELALRHMKLFSRYVEEEISYLDLHISNQRISRVAFPMLCFCDINLHKVNFHVDGEEGYGKFGIGLKKNWCEKKGVQPITYVNPDAYQTMEFARVFNKGIALIDKESAFPDDFFDLLLKQLAITKPLKGTMEKKGKYIEKNFHDEQEWRFVPRIDSKVTPDFLNDVLDSSMMDWFSRRDLSDGLKTLKESQLELEINAINYIFVEDDKNKYKVLELINELFDDMDKLDMASKVVVYNQLEKDW